jgi:hypothetical protein
MRRAALAASLALLTACSQTTVRTPLWAEWTSAQIDRHARRTVIDQSSQVVEQRECWLGPADLSGEFLLRREGDRLTLLGQIIDDRPLCQSRPERLQPAWWLQRLGADGVALTLLGTRGEDNTEIVAALGSAGFDPQLFGAAESDEIEVWPTPTGARVRISLDLMAHGGAQLAERPAEVTVYDVDGPADWSVHRARLR